MDMTGTSLVRLPFINDDRLFPPSLISLPPPSSKLFSSRPEGEMMTLAASRPLCQIPSSLPSASPKPTRTKLLKETQILPSTKPNNYSWFSSFQSWQLIHKFIPLSASVALLVFANPAKAGFLSGFSGIESIPGPQLPQVEFLNRFNEENQKKYAENDARFKSSPILKELLERSKLNKEKNGQEIQDKYCIRGAEWGVGDCSTAAMTREERDNFISMLKEKAGTK